MANAPNYTPTTSFATDETNQVAGRSTVKTVSLDAELANASSSINALNTNIKLLQRDDGKVKDHLIEPYALSDQTRAIMATSGGVPRGNWSQSTAYALKDSVQYGSVAYLCTESHTSGLTFDTSKFMSITGDGTALQYAAQAANSAIEAEISQVAAAASEADAETAAAAALVNKNATDENVTNAAASAVSASNSSTAAAGSAVAAAASEAAAAASALALVNSPVAAPIHAATLKATPVDADEFGYADSDAGFGLKRFTWWNIKAVLAAACNAGWNSATATSANNAGTSGTFTITGTGFVANPTATAKWRLNNGVVTLYIPALTMQGESNSTNFTLTGLPAGIVPVSMQRTQPMAMLSGGVVGWCYGQISAGSNVINLLGAASWAGSGTKSIACTTLTWTLD